MMNNKIFLLFLIILPVSVLDSYALDLKQLTLAKSIRDNYHLRIYASLPDARSMAVANNIKTVFVGTRSDDRLYAIHQNKIHILAEGLKSPNGVAWRAPYLYLAEQHKITRYRFDEFSSQLPNAEFIIDLPNYRHHGWRVIEISPDGKFLYVSLGAPCNVCKVKNLYGTIARLDLIAPNKKLEVVAYGVRNSVGMAFHPENGKLYFTDNGVDNMGDDLPPEEVNRLDKIGQHFGFPYYGGGKARTSRPLPDADFTFPLVELPAHNAALGIHFYQSDKNLPLNIPELDGKAIIALHGSWNRRIPDGYRVVMVDFKRNPAKVEVLIDNFLDMREGRGRPVAIKTLWDGSLLISDDGHGKIYQLIKNQQSGK